MWARRRCFLLAVAGTAVFGQVVIGTAGAFTFPTGASTSSSCPAFPVDPTQLATQGAIDTTVTSVANTYVYSAATTLPAGTYQITLGTGNAGYWVIQTQDTGGTWETDVDPVPASLGATDLYVPAGPTRVGVYFATAEAVPVNLESVPVAEQAGGNAQSLAVLCADAMSNAGQAHTDAGAITTAVTTAAATAHADATGITSAVSSASSTAHTDASTIAGDVNTLGGGKTLATLDTDLATVATDLGTLHADNGTTQADLATIAADESGGDGGDGGGGSGCVSPCEVELSPADRQLVADVADGAHTDLWAVSGLFVALIAGGWLFRGILRP